MVAAVPRELMATLPHPPGVNTIWRTGRGRNGLVTKVYKTAPAVQWDQDAVLLLRAAGWQPLPPGRYWLALGCVLHTVRHDIDSCLKLALDVVAAALSVDDGCIGALSVAKIAAKSRADQRLELVANIEPVADPEGWADRSRQAANDAIWDQKQGRVGKQGIIGGQGGVSGDGRKMGAEGPEAG